MAKLFIGTEQDRATLRKIVSWWQHLRGAGITNTPEGPSFNIPVLRDIKTVDTRAIRMQIVSIQNDTTTCKYFDGVTATGDDILVAKPFLLQHDHPERHELITSMATVGPQEVTASDSSDPVVTETWKVTESYQVDDEIYATFAPVGGTGIDGVEYLEDNRDSRAWAVVE